MTYYLAGGSNHPGTTIPANVRGDCPHQHRTPAAAQACADADDRSVKLGHGPHAYSDRRVLAVEEGLKRPLTPEEAAGLFGD